MLRYPFKYFLSCMDEMARPAMDYTDSSGEKKSAEPIASVPYFMGKNDIYYLYQFPPSLWPEAFHYRVNTIFREFIENLQENEENKVNGKPATPWNDSRTVTLEWKPTSVGKEAKATGVDSKIIKYQFSNIKTFIAHYWDALQRDIDTEFFAKNDDTPEARAEYEKILQKALADNADTGGFFGTSLRKLVQCDISTTVKKKIKGQEREIEEKGTIWSCIGYRPISYDAVSDQIGNWLAASNHGWSTSHVDPAYKKGSVPNKGSRNYDVSFITNAHKLNSIQNQIKNAGGNPFHTDNKGYGFVSWRGVKKIVEFLKTNPDGTTEVLDRQVEPVNADHDADYGVHGLEKSGRLPVLEPGYKIDSKSAQNADVLSSLKDFSELNGDEELARKEGRDPQELLKKLMVASQETFDQMVADIEKNPGTRAVKRLKEQIAKIADIKEIVSIINNPEAITALKSQIYQERANSKNEKEKAALKAKYELIQLMEEFKGWCVKKAQEIGSHDAQSFKDQFEKLKTEFKGHQNAHYSYEAQAHKDKSPNDEEKTNISKNDSSRKDMLKQLENAFNSYEFLVSTNGSDKITISNILPLISIFLREIQSNAKKYDAFSYAIATHNNQRENKNPLGLDMANPLSLGDKKYPGLGDKTRGFGMFEPNNSSKHRINSTQENWEKIKKYFGNAELNEFPFDEEEIDKLLEEGHKYLSKVLDYISKRSDILDFLGLEPQEIANISLNKISDRFKKANQEGKTAPEDIRKVLNELKDINNKISDLEELRNSGSIDSVIKDAINFALKIRTTGDQIASAAKFDPSFPTSLEYSKDYIAKAAETYLMRAAGAGPLQYWLSAVNDKTISPLKKLKIYLGAAEEVKETVKNYVYTLCQLPQEGNDTALATSRRKRASFTGIPQQTSQFGSQSGEGDFDMDSTIAQKFDASKVDIGNLMKSPALVKVIKSSLFDNSDPTKSLETIIRNDYRKMMPQSYTFGMGVEKGTQIGHDVEQFSQFLAKALADKVEKAQKEKSNRLERLKTLDADVDTKQDNDVLSTMGFASLLYSLMELEVDQQYAKELKGIKDKDQREAEKQRLVKKAMQDWKSINLGISGESAISAPNLEDPTVRKLIARSLNAIIDDEDSLSRGEINTSDIPAEIRAPEIVNALEVVALIIKDLPKDENGSFDFDDLDREIAGLSGAGSPWADDPNKEYKINVAVISVDARAPLKYKQAATAVEAPEESRVSLKHREELQARLKALKANKVNEPEEEPVSTEVPKPEEKPFKHFPAPNRPFPRPSGSMTAVPSTGTPKPPVEEPKKPEPPASGLGAYTRKRSSANKFINTDDTHDF